MVSSSLSITTHAQHPSAASPAALHDQLRTLIYEAIAPIIEDLIRHLQNQFVSGGRTPIETLTHREQQVLRLLMVGRSNIEIGNELFISRATVATHVSKILDKLGATSRFEAAAIARQHRFC